MNFNLSEEQLAIADMAKSLFTDTCTDQYLRDYDESGQGTMSDLWLASIETGLHSVIIPEANGGIDLGMMELSLVLQAQGGSLAQVPIWRHQVAAAAIAKFAVESHTEIVKDAAQGNNLLTIGYNLNNTAEGSGVIAIESDDGVSLSGVVQAVANADKANFLLLSFSLNNETRWALVDTTTKGLTLTTGQMTQGEDVADVMLDKVEIDNAAVLATEAHNWILPRIFASLAALQVGVSEAQITKTVEYVSERKQFGRAIGTFQAVQMTMADTKIALEALRSNLWQLCYRLDNDLPCEHEAYATAWHACDAGHKIGHAAQHVHGGFGVDVSYIIFRYLYWSRAISLNLGGSPALLAKLGEVLRVNDKLGWKYDLDENYAN
ncbi:acyl-CoA dehydrogenase family protein [Aliiglaciecola lipolytica]|uniref:Acyl-CoA dehydrogenase domain-containing protein n=1 Tax=Aliiglaciecola lipolytica E3 TaxID=1127673 RepID=K6YT98_9ALTE|nr:acyl-CoA dehydrogenase family protein [Aliiglaciecola lipolytica]GAC14520.1 acyl-CoA dehydrogenase domain-containing protein [Aliiglaciecola lipolytica E3]